MLKRGPEEGVGLLLRVRAWWSEVVRRRTVSWATERKMLFDKGMVSMCGLCRSGLDGWLGSEGRVESCEVVGHCV